MNTSRKILVVYYSATGNTARVARDVAQRLNADVESIQEKKHAGPLKSMWRAIRNIPAEIDEPLRKPSDYDLTIVGTPVWVGRMTPAVRAYLQRVRPELSRVAFFVTSANTDVAKVSPAFEVLSGRTAGACAGFNARELRDPVTYENKLATFVRTVESAAAADRPTTVHASAA